MNEFKPLPYGYNTLEPFIDEQTMKIHHDKHHQAYFDKFTAAISGTELENKDVKEILSDLSQLPEDIKMAVINNGGGFYHHSFFWEIMKKDVPFSGEVAEAINAKFGSFEKFKEDFSKAALTVFGSGWAWLVLNDGELEIIQTKNQDCPLSISKKPLLAIDVWEHAYYLKYQNKRAEYVENFFNIINWEKVNELFLEAKG
ncbi:superoxide dismutase [Candidatus Woesearchaeota archaeon]|jgi:superoxide dismutase, Fe-Mn family|nr:superoxide dismutase [Candidatus Woesearchaeota archaeon]